MATIVTRAGKGSPLTNNEVDANFTGLNSELSTMSRAISVQMTASATVGGIQQLDNDNLDMGTNDFTLEFDEVIPTTRPSADIVLDRKHDGTNGYILTLRTTGIVRLQINATTYDSTAPLASATNVNPKLYIQVIRETATVAGSVTHYSNGVIVGTAVAISAGAPVSVNNASARIISGTATTRTAGSLQASRLFNRALTAAEVLDYTYNLPALENRGANNSSILKIPADFPYTVPFNIIKTGRDTVTTDIDMAAYKITPSVTYYLSPTGNDANNGLTVGSPKRSISVLATALNASPPSGADFVLAPGAYNNAIGINGGSFNFRLNMICPTGRAVIAKTQSASWGKTGGRTNIYQATVANPPSVVDLTNTDAYGIEKRLTIVASLDLCDTTPDSMIYTGGVLYVNTFNSRSPDANILVFDSVGINWSQGNNRSLYFENIDFWGGEQPARVGNTGVNTNMAFLACSFRYCAGDGNGFETSSASTAATLLTIFKDCDASYNNRDGFGYRGAHRAVEISCKGVYNGWNKSSGSDNGSTTHNSVVSVRVNGIYRYNDDRNVHDIDTAQSLLVCCAAGNPQNSSTGQFDNANFLFGNTSGSTTKAWLYACQSLGGAVTDFGVMTGCTGSTYLDSGFDSVYTTGTALVNYNSFSSFGFGLVSELLAINAQSDTGQIFDSSGNKNHALLPASGAAVVGRPVSQTREVRWTNNWSNTNELQYIGGVNQAILPANAYIESIIATVTGSGQQNVNVGNGADADRYAVIVPGFDVSLLSRTTDGVNLKLTATPTSLSTMTVAWVIRYSILEG
jgi:hypothetical protein